MYDTLRHNVLRKQHEEQAFVQEYASYVFL
jgi:hypothetical protein